MSFKFWIGVSSLCYIKVLSGTHLTKKLSHSLRSLGRIHAGRLRHYAPHACAPYLKVSTNSIGMEDMKEKIIKHWKDALIFGLLFFIIIKLYQIEESTDEIHDLEMYIESLSQEVHNLEREIRKKR